MNRSYNKIRHIQEANQRLEKRLLSEQDVPVSGQTPEQKGVETNRHVINLLNDGYKEVPKADLPDGQYSKKGGGYIINIFNQDGKTDTGYRFVMTFGIRGLYNGEPIRIIGGTIPISDTAKESGMGIYKILYKPVK